MCNIHDWLNANKLSLNISKTKSILVCSKRIKSTTQEANLSLPVENNPIEQVQSSTYLGVVVDDQFHFKTHFESLISKLRRVVGILRRVSPFIPQDTRKILYNTLFLPHIDYCSPVWCTLPKTCIQRIQRIQNRGMRIILDSHPRSHADDLLNELQFMSTNQRLHFNICAQMWKIVHGNAPSYLANVFTIKHNNYSRHSICTRSSAKLDVCLERVHKDSFQY